MSDAQAKVEAWCAGRAGMRVHGTTQCRVHRDHHIEIAKALYSIPGNLLGARVQVRADRRVVRVFHRSQLIKVHPRQQPGHRSTDPADLPSEQTTYALHDIAHLQRLAAGHGEAIGIYAENEVRCRRRAWRSIARRTSSSISAL